MTKAVFRLSSFINLLTACRFSLASVSKQGKLQLINAQARCFLQRLFKTDGGLAQLKCQPTLSVPAKSMVRQFIEIRYVWMRCAERCSGIPNTNRVQHMCSCGSDTCQKLKALAGWEDILLHHWSEIVLASMKHRLIGLENISGFRLYQNICDRDLNRLRCKSCKVKFPFENRLH